jgi:hypothetical protein
MAQPLTKCIINGGVQYKFVVWFLKLRLVSWDSEALRIPATAYAQTLWPIRWTEKWYYICSIRLKK